VICVIARLTAREGKEGELERLLLGLAQSVRMNEPGCVHYQLCKGKNAREYVMMERYESQEALGAHVQTAHYKAAGPELGALLDGRPAIELLTEL